MQDQIEKKRVAYHHVYMFAARVPRCFIFLFTTRSKQYVGNEMTTLKIQTNFPENWSKQLVK